MKIHHRYASFAFANVATLTAAQQTLTSGSNPHVDISSCQDLSCSPPDGSICSTGDLPGPEPGIGIAADAVNTSTSTLSLTLIDGLNENGFTGIAGAAYEHSGQQLFIGLNPSSRDDYPTGCVLMIQYQGQTFPLESLPDDDIRDEMDEGTTSCHGVLDIFCRSSIFNIIQSFNSSGGEDDRCERLTQHVNSRLQGNPGSCGDEGTWIANFMNVTGGTIPGPDSNPASDRKFGDDCKPVLPQSYELYKVAEMRQFTFVDPPDSDVHEGLFGGRSGFTPVVTAIYENEQGADPAVQFLCMKTLERGGDPRGTDSGAVSLRLAFSILGVGLMFAL